MADEIKLTVANPMETVLDTAAARVMLPSVNGYITILPQRAPMILQLQNGLMQLIDGQGKPTARYFVRRGVATISENKCMVSTEELIEYDKITFAEAEEAAKNKKWPAQREFYAKVAEILRVIKA